MEGLVVPLAPDTLATEALQEPERRQRLEDRRPHGVEVDRRRHHSDERLVRSKLRQRELLDVDRLAGVLVGRLEAGEHFLLVGLDERAAHGLRDRQCRDLLAGGVAIKRALERAGIDAEQVDYVLMGQVLQAGAGQITARQAAGKAGVAMTVPAMTLNKVCLSGINAIYLADQMINNGDAEVVVAGGMESMTNAPYLLPGARAGYRMGNAEVLDSMVNDGLWCAFDAVHMGAGTENYVGQ